MTKRERALREAGYTFTGHYTRDKAAAKAKAQEYRKKGYRATVVTTTSKGRVYSTEGYMAVITLSPCPFCEGEAEFIDGEQRQEYGNEQVGCTRCMALTAPEPTKQAAARRWNSRGNHPELDYVAAIESDINKLRTRLQP